MPERSVTSPACGPQHLSSVLACAQLCGATTEGASVGCREFTFVPGARISGGSFTWNIGTAGSATMLALSVLPVACFADGPVTARITGGVYQDFAPSPHHLQHVLAPLLKRMGVSMELKADRLQRQFALDLTNTRARDREVCGGDRLPCRPFPTDLDRLTEHRKDIQSLIKRISRHSTEV
ncbi:MAG TPA: RNA 3'-terminal phosphate cyclase [Candidatus Binatia bacterium]|jgi:hypothetical protein|nr:RNA 3'-terminal phosphate cyclase [Candidatus Binatia bacterium]